jgi:GntR family transcriptional regulator / MocR family aminotransferase
MRVTLYESLRQSIRDGRLRPGEKLPSTRAMARQLGISRTTVLDVYHQLSLDGLVSARIGSGTRVTGSPLRAFIRGSHYPVEAVPFRDHDGNVLYVHR